MNPIDPDLKERAYDLARKINAYFRPVETDVTVNELAMEIMDFHQAELTAAISHIELQDMQAAAVMTAAIQNTESSIKDRIGRENPYWTQCYGDVCAAVDREIALRKERDTLAEWKRQQLIVTAWWAKIDTFVRNHPHAVMGKHVSETALAMLRQRDDLLTVLKYADRRIKNGCVSDAQKAIGEAL